MGHSIPYSWTSSPTVFTDSPSSMCTRRMFTLCVKYGGEGGSGCVHARYLTDLRCTSNTLDTQPNRCWPDLFSRDKNGRILVYLRDLSFLRQPLLTSRRNSVENEIREFLSSPPFIKCHFMEIILYANVVARLISSRILSK